jgi:hypothetical protein
MHLFEWLGRRSNDPPYQTEITTCSLNAWLLTAPLFLYFIFIILLTLR